MRLIPRKVHAVLDFVFAAALMATPKLGDFSDMVWASYSLMGVGGAIVVYSLLTQYELGIIRRIPYRVHLEMDFGVGIVLALLPLMLGFYNMIFLPHVFMGLIAMGLSMFSENTPFEIAPKKRVRPRQTTRGAV